MIACLRRVDRGDPVDSILRDYPEEAGWLREHLTVSDELQMDVGPSADKKSRARESLLSALAHSAPPASVATRLRFGFALVQIALIIVTCLGVTAGAAAASGVNLRSVAGDVVDSLVEPLPLSAPRPISAEGHQDAIGLDPGEPAAGDNTAGGERPTRPLDDGGVDADDATPSAAPGEAASDDANPPVQDGPSDQTNPPGNGPPDDNPAADDPPSDENPGHGGPEGPGSGGDNGQPGGNDSNGNGSDGGHPGGPNGNPSNGSDSGPDGSNSPGNRGDNGQPGGNGSNGNGSDAEPQDGPNGSPSNGPDGANANPSNDPNRGGSSDQCGGGPSGSNRDGKGGGAGKGGTK